MDKNFNYINSFYGKKFKSGLKARALGKEGILMYGTNYVYLKIDGKKSAPYHPNDVELIESGEIKNG